MVGVSVISQVLILGEFRKVGALDSLVMMIFIFLIVLSGAGIVFPWVRAARIYSLCLI